MKFLILKIQNPDKMGLFWVFFVNFCNYRSRKKGIALPIVYNWDVKLIKFFFPFFDLQFLKSCKNAPVFAKSCMFLTFAVVGVA